MISILFYVDNDPKSGAGHFVRSFRLAVEFQKHNCKVSFSTSSVFIPLPFLPEVQSLNFIKLDTSQKYDLVVIDNYALTTEDHKAFYNQTNKILVLDDLCNRPLKCDFLWDPTITRKKDEYYGQVPDNCKLFLGGNYQIFSDEHIKTAQNYGEEQRSSADAIHLYGGQTKNINLSHICVALSKKFKINLLGDMHIILPNLSENMTIMGTSINPIETFQYPTPASRPHYSLLNKAKIKNEFNITIPFWKDSLDECLRILGERK